MAKQDDFNELQELKAAIKAKKPERLYFFHGEEMFLLRYYLGQVKKILIDDLTESFNFHRFTNETFEMQSFADAVENLPMMAEFTMVQVDDIDLFKMAEAERNKIIEILSDIPEYCTVVFTYETAAWKPDKRLKTLYDAVSSNGRIVEFAKQEQRELISWIIRHFAALKKRITPDLCAYLIDITDGTMTSLGSEISKIASYSGAEEVCKADIDAVTEPVPDAVAFQMANDISSGKYGDALNKLNQLLKMQEDPLSILGTIGANFRRIGAAKTLLDNGKNTSELARLYNLKEYAAKKTMESARRVSAQFCRRAAELILETDRKIKTSIDAPERLLEMLILQLAQEASK
jgi:DNA polymerase-3 subunit delta